jgi:hypothetical protein
MVEEEVDLESLLVHANEREKEFDWRTAAEAYSKAMGLLPPKDLLRAGNVEEASAHALYRYAFQAETNEEFKARVGKAVEQYGKAKEAYSKLDEKETIPWSLRCDAMRAYLLFWPEADSAEKRRLIDEAWSLAKDAMDAFEEAQDYPQFMRTNNSLTFAASIGYAYSADTKFREKLVTEALEYSEKAVKLLPEGEDKADVARAYMNASYYKRLFCSDFMDIDHRGEWDEKAGEFWRKGLELSEAGSLNAITFSCKFGVLPSTSTDEENRRLCQEALEYATRTNDRLRMASIFEWKEVAAFLRAHEAVDPDQRNSMADEALAYAEKARQCYSILSAVYLSEAIFWSGSPYSGFYALMASLETDLRKKREFAKKGVEAFEEGLRTAEESDYPEGIASVHSDATQILTNLARTEGSEENRKKILERALNHATEHMSKWRVLHPMDFGLSEGMALLADIEHELASLAVDPKHKISLYREAISHMNQAYEGLTKETKFASAAIERWTRLRLGVFQYQVADWSLQLYEISKEKSDLASAAAAFHKAVELYKRADQPSRAAESYWKEAQAQDALGDYLGASETFVLASGSYKNAAGSLPRLSNLYHDYDFYMQAWSQIELARYHHTRQDAKAASECYEKASELHESTVKWRFLVSNYKAWAEVEKGEDLSRKEESREAIVAFENAARLFAESKEPLGRQLESAQSKDERENVIGLAKAADLRKEFCEGRLALEEAKILDKQGDEFGSCEKFGRAAATFERLSTILESDQDRREAQLTMVLSRAWETMTKAQAEASPDLFERAALMFEQAKDLSVGENAKLLAMGHSRFCKALAAGTKFADTGDSSLHTVATKNLESAAICYLKAGLENDSEYAKGSKLLFDAYVYMDKANREEDQAKKARLFAMTEKVLETSAASYSKAEYPKKKDQVLKLLQKVKGERELAVTLMEVLHAPDVIGSTTALPSPTPTHEAAVGMQRFEHADIQVTLVARPKELNVGQELSLDIELVNAGRASAQLTMIEETVPHGFDVVHEPEEYTMEDGKINLKGRRLDALKTEDLRLVVKPTTKGNFSLRPRVMYLDESGTYRSCEPAPVEVAVKEMGISGWIRGT